MRLRLKTSTGKDRQRSLLVRRHSATNGPKPQLQLLWNKNLIEEGAWGTIPAVADLDGDSKSEVITGHNVFDGITGTGPRRLR